MALRYFLLLIPFFFAACGSQPDNSTGKKETVKPPPLKKDSLRPGVIYPQAMTAFRKSVYDDYAIRIGDSLYNCSYKGRIESMDTSGNVRSFIGDLHAEYLIDKIYLQPLGNNRFFIEWQETNHLGVFCHYGLFDRGKPKPVWLWTNSAILPGPPAVDSNNVYITSLGMVAKFRLSDGHIMWQLDSLFDPTKLAYKQFEPPLVYTSTVCFYDRPIKGRKPKRDSIWINDNSGKVVR